MKQVATILFAFLVFSLPYRDAQSRPHLEGKGLRFKDVTQKIEGYFLYLEGSSLQAQLRQNPHSENFSPLLPCQGTITSEYGPRRLGKKSRMHEGIDIAAPVGTPIVAPAEGVVIFSGRKSGYGLTVVIDHGGEISTLFGHNSKVFVHEGDKVTKGQEISRVGNSGTSTGPHLHYEVHRDGAPIDPSEFI